MAKRFYIAATVQDTFEGKTGYYAFIIPVSEADNLQAVLSRHKGLLHTNIMPTKKRATEIVQFWNECYKNNGTYMFGDTPFSML